MVTRYVVPEAEGESFRLLLREALEALTSRPGCLSGHVGRATDDAQLWLLTTTWEGVGAYRRALSSYDVKLRAVPVMYRAVDEVTAYEVLVEAEPDPAGARLTDHEPDRAADAGSAHPSRS